VKLLRLERNDAVGFDQNIARVVTSRIAQLAARTGAHARIELERIPWLRVPAVFPGRADGLALIAALYGIRKSSLEIVGNHGAGLS
jgi:hypothetical protein